MSEARIVWILGAGASVGLGGPTLNSLLSLASDRDLRARYEGTAPGLFGPTAFMARRLYHHGRRFPEGQVHPDDRGKPGELLWKHAEDYLDYLDTAAEKPDGVFARRLRLTLERLAPLVGPDKPPLSANELRDAARRLVAAECCGFLEDADVTSERWASYVRWAGSLGRLDTLITFNYDRVIETIPGTRIKVILPDTDDLSQAVASDCCPMLKLHGSVDWRMDGNRVTRSDNRTFALTCADGELAVATPGPAKAKHANHQGVAKLWDAAGGRIEDADILVFVGYRIPHSDGLARERLLRAITISQELTDPGNRLSVHIVLGTDLQAAERLESLLTFTAPSFGHKGQPALIHRHPLYAEDFFGVVHRERL
jgi:hypothetical protein